MIFFGIDPGTAVTGFGVIATEGNTLTYKDSGVINIDKKASLSEKLENIYDGLLCRMGECQPSCVSIEQAFYAKNVQTTLILGHARGVALLAAQKIGAQVLEFTPREIKKAVVGNGNAQKDQVEYMVKMILGISKTKTRSDEFDALATAICAFNHYKCFSG